MYELSPLSTIKRIVAFQILIFDEIRYKLIGPTYICDGIPVHCLLMVKYMFTQKL